MTTLTFDPFEEFQQFLIKLSFLELIENSDYIAASKKLHKRVLAILIVEHQFDLELTSDLPELKDTIKSYLNEFRSDLLSSLFIFQVGLYKAAMMTARSALENLLRVIAGCQGLDFRACKSVSDLIELVKVAPLRSSNPLFKASIQTLLTSYSDFCDYVHSTGEEFLSLDRKLGDMPRWEPGVGTERADSLVKMIQAATCTLLVLKPLVLQHLRHDQKDIVLDALSKQMKAGLVAG